ncbi:RtcB family protein [Gordonia sp. PP30]|uniref:RtcB family protein n=1 Tax=unclassified Gordonia (in: high G+C Gram-positive bacteria) TaxID=2657482 RepID=UPI001FFEF587|nr:RtcB family protein [Gordonia sp. PP30]UQE75175.1 RtcB family protein [Gordonia sp. PP30]
MSAFPVTLTGQSNVRLWAHEHQIEQAALNQLRNIARLDPVRQVAVMPDVHLGKGATVGSVIAMEDAVSPAAVGVDIGCGVAGVKTSLTASDLPDGLGALRSAIEAAIPVGFKVHKQQVRTRRFGGAVERQSNHLWEAAKGLHANVSRAMDRAPKAVGTLGGGNHFIEVCLDDGDAVWLTLHSGSRNIGKELAERHIATAKGLAHNQDLPDRDLAYFLSGSAEMDAYLYDLRWAQDYAAHSRAVMMALFRGVVAEQFPQAAFTDEINVHHNYVGSETVDGAEYVVTRKGAIRAGSGDLALIPGSMGTGSYVVRGLGNPASLYSASHGAGRRMSRTAAKRTFTVDDLRAQTDGIECRKDAGVVDEIPGAYKDLDSVIEAQSNLVEVVTRLRTILCVKG